MEISILHVYKSNLGPSNSDGVISKMQQNAPFCVLSGGGEGGAWQTLDPLPLLVSRGLVSVMFFPRLKRGVFPTFEIDQSRIPVH
jgi:hypothetical protein